MAFWRDSGLGVAARGVIVPGAGDNLILG
jgi:hypothetical protein